MPTKATARTRSAPAAHQSFGQRSTTAPNTGPISIAGMKSASSTRLIAHGEWKRAYAIANSAGYAAPVPSDRLSKRGKEQPRSMLRLEEGERFVHLISRWCGRAVRRAKLRRYRCGAQKALGPRSTNAAPVASRLLLNGCAALRAPSLDYGTPTFLALTWSVNLCNRSGASWHRFGLLSSLLCKNPCKADPRRGELRTTHWLGRASSLCGSGGGQSAVATCGITSPVFCGLLSSRSQASTSSAETFRGWWQAARWPPG